MKHLAIFTPILIEEILTGKRKVDVRVSKTKVAPFGAVSAGDIVYIKPSGKEIIGQFRVKKVIFFDGLTDEDLEEIKNRYGVEMKLAQAKYATLIFIAASNRFITSPIKLPKKDVRGWIVLD